MTISPEDTIKRLTQALGLYLTADEIARVLNGGPAFEEYLAQESAAQAELRAELARLREETQELSDGADELLARLESVAGYDPS